MPARMLYVHALSPVHTGIGQASGVIDLPIAREKHTNYPFLPGSGLKGVLRDAAKPDKDDTVATAAFKLAFGPDTQNASDNHGALQFTDARLLVLPVRSFAGTFAWVTCREALLRWKSDYESAGFTDYPALPTAPDDDKILVASPSELAVLTPRRVFLDDLDFTIAANQPEVAKVADAVAAQLFDDDPWRTRFIERFAIVSDNIFSSLNELATDVVARIKINDDTKTVDDGGLWYEEAIPAESVFVSTILLDPRDKDHETRYVEFVANAAKNVLQIGGKASVGRGLVRMHVREGIS